MGAHHVQLPVFVFLTPDNRSVERQSRVVAPCSGTDRAVPDADSYPILHVAFCGQIGDLATTHHQTLGLT